MLDYKKLKFVKIYWACTNDEVIYKLSLGCSFLCIKHALQTAVYIKFQSLASHLIIFGVSADL